MKKILLLSDIHGNFPALQAVEQYVDIESFDAIFNCGDSTVYAPFANQVMDWLDRYQVISIRGNTDRKVIKLLKRINFKKPGKPEKRIMYTHTAQHLTIGNQKKLKALKKKKSITLQQWNIGLFHGSPVDPDEFLFPSTSDNRFAKLAKEAGKDIIITGHSHTPYYKIINRTHFINPGSVGRMFDGNATASFALLTLKKNTIDVVHHRCCYDIERVVSQLATEGLPEIYAAMYRQGKKLN